MIFPAINLHGYLPKPRTLPRREDKLSCAAWRSLRVGLMGLSEGGVEQQSLIMVNTG